MPASFSRGVSVVHALSEKLLRKLPENVLPPLLVIMLITPPEKRPYSAEIPDVSTLVCSIGILDEDVAARCRTGCR